MVKPELYIRTQQTIPSPTISLNSQELWNHEQYCP